MLAELDEILARDVKRLATARDLPRLVRHVRCLGPGDTLLFDGAEGGGVLELLRTLRQVAGAAGAEVADAGDESETARRYMATLTGPERALELFVMHSVNQNIIAPAILRLKYELARTGCTSKDGEWQIAIRVDGDKTAVTHRRGEIESKSGSFCVTWELTLVMRPARHLLSLVSIESLKPGADSSALRATLEAAIRAAIAPPSASIQLPEVREYLSASYFNWK